MKIHYPLGADAILAPSGQRLLATMSRAGVNKVWLHGFFYGHMCSSLLDLQAARKRLIEWSFEVGIINLPLGHPGNSLNPDDPNLDLTLPSQWAYRIDREGHPVYFCADIEETMMADSREAIIALRDSGFAEIFFDDDLRQGNWGQDIQGCFCDRCLAKFNRRFGRQATRDSLSEILKSEPRSPVLRDWVNFQCSKINKFLRSQSVPGVHLGVMVMADGDERHGIDLEAIQAIVPSCMIRVGEGHFSDQEFGSVEGKAADFMSIQKHLNRVIRANSFSETTCFPPGALNPTNLAFKATLALAAGVPNLMIMSGTHILTEEYWEVWTEHLEMMSKLEADFANIDRSCPVHVACGSGGMLQEDVRSTTLPTLSGLPAKPIRGGDSPAGGELLLVFGDWELSGLWEPMLSHYKAIILDAVAAGRNPAIAHSARHRNVSVWNHEVKRHSTGEDMVGLRKLIAKGSWSFPQILEGSNILLIWPKASGGVVLINLEANTNRCSLGCGQWHQTVSLPPLSWEFVPLDP